MAPATSQRRWCGLLVAAGVVRLTYMGRTDTCMKAGSVLFVASVLPLPRASPRLCRILRPDVRFPSRTRSCALDVTRQPRAATATLILRSSCRASPAKGATALEPPTFRWLNRGVKHLDSYSTQLTSVRVNPSIFAVHVTVLGGMLSEPTLASKPFVSPRIDLRAAGVGERAMLASPALHVTIHISR